MTIDIELNNQVLHDRYCIQTLLGRQTGRRTFLANDLQTHSLVVIKLLLFGPDFTWDELKLFEREAHTLKALNHSLIPQYLDSFEVNLELGKGFALVQSYIEARSLQDWIQAGRNFSEAELRAIAEELLAILSYLHTHQPPVVHRDLKPSNILLGDRSGNSPGQIYLVDFGSVQTAVHSGTITIVGTYGYMPPEQFGGKTSPASDLYSLGATLIYLLTKTHPADLPSRNGRVRFEADGLASEPFQAWLRCLIQPDVNRRFKNAQSALAALQTNQLLFPLETVQLKPRGSRVRLSKTDEQLQIYIPPLRRGQKLRVIYSAFMQTVFVCCLLLLGYLKPELGFLIAPFVLWIVLSIWVRSLYKIFEETELTIDHKEICLTRRWLRFQKKYVSRTEDIIRVERRYNEYRQYSALIIWAGNQSYSLQTFGINQKGVHRLSEVELDWLAAELSDWLDLSLSVQKPSEIPSPDIQSRITLENTLSVKPTTALCTLTKNTERIEIYVPDVHEFISAWLGITGTLLFISVFFSKLVLAAGGTLLVALGVGVVVCIFWKILIDKKQPNFQNTKVALKIDRQEVSLWKQSQTLQWRCLKRAKRNTIHKLQLVYKVRKETPQSCYIKVSTKSSSNSREDFDIGQPFLLSRKEAEWLAYELSTWLNLPVTEVEVVENSV